MCDNINHMAHNVSKYEPHEGRSCRNNAELIMVYGDIKTYRCAKCGKEWEEKDVCSLRGNDL